MSAYIIQEQTLTDIANAVREKSGTTDPIKVSELPTEIANIQAGGGDSQWEGYWLRTATELTIPEGTKKFYQRAFQGCYNLETVNLPSTLVGIDQQAFYLCDELKSITFPPSLETISAQAFYYCSALANVTFKGTPASIASNCFNSCTNLLTINVPWAEGEVANAPWGAHNATINYNYVG